MIGYLQYIWLFVTLGTQEAVETLWEVEKKGTSGTLGVVETHKAV